MKEIFIKDLQTFLIQENDNDNVFKDTLHINLSNKQDKREKGVDTIMYECENNTTLILEKDCKTNKIIGMELVF